MKNKKLEQAVKSAEFYTFKQNISRAYIISLITGWTFYTEKYKARCPDV